MPSKTVHNKTHEKHSSVHHTDTHTFLKPQPVDKSSLNTEQGVLEWKAPGRPFRKRGKQYYLTALLIMLLIEIILFLFSEYILMFVVFTLVFLSFVLVTIPPKEFTYRISSQGVQIENTFYLWKELYDFYIVEKDGYKSLRITTEAYLPGELILTLGDMPEEEVKNALISYLPFREYVEPTFMDKAANWLERNFPIENN